MEYYRVNYTHLKGYGVFVPFATIAEALEYIHNNAMVCPLPGLFVTHAVYDGAHCTERGIDWRAADRGECVVPYPHDASQCNGDHIGPEDV